MATKSHQVSEAEVRSWGFPTAFTWTDGPNAHYPPHTHTETTTHLILRGEFIIAFPEEEDTEKKTYTVGDRVDVAAHRTHEVWIGPAGCTYVIGQ
ncbi:hypothetical protein M430DRAFT_43172 [Amorphotheca resinae ATCC 22711]|uniref:Cupin 2 conserved barrel domain-containing protein n=1 Tax=Amorphotheca resinae ATCC 22711 TaxID=857342 RepID=A0A2T3AXT3_AMORE|nr:hypothetical protein M430DRAFT_43172 [Amorphotheca resinae ATCC 22711]PSS14878.1 hypothetical protein M430DRAFT_43172 [Amorphotheca resinae ATCC 22711]